MDATFELHGVQFVWNTRKAILNVRKHGMSFKEAAEAFFDPFLVVLDAADGEELRSAIIGMDEQRRILFVVHAQVKEEAIRIISARRATRKERMEYEA